MDIIWVMTGNFVFCDEDIAARIGSVLPLEETPQLKSMAEHMLAKRYEPSTNENATLRFYESLFEVERFLRLLFVERTRMAMHERLKPPRHRKDGLSNG